MVNDSVISKTLNDWSDVFMRHSFSQFKQFMDLNGLSPSQVITLFRLYHAGPCGVTAVSTLLGVTNAASSQLIERLVLMGYIERSEDVSDRRARQLTLTIKGRALVEEGISARRKWLETLTTQLNPEQQAEVVAALSVLTACASHLVDEPGNEKRRKILVNQADM